MLGFQQRLLLEEQEKFIDYRFNKALVRRLTLLEGSELEGTEEGEEQEGKKRRGRRKGIFIAQKFTALSSIPIIN